ncbi:GntR family transcriptional regulator [Aeromicrobium alkaliterrae]|uniref:GntR family transcriptional regulator n=1 Tax=Aeromicrobium alkaliterrae TaxID=302168 RepID=A0ABN2JSI9_9ACTN
MTQPSITLDRSSPVPLYFQVAEQLERAIVAGEIAAGERLDNEISMARDLGLSRPTMRQAIQVLVDKGMLVRRRGVGTQVVQGRVRRQVELTSLFDDLSAAGHHPQTRVLSCERLEADPEIAEELQLGVGTLVWSVRRLRLIGDQPLAVMHNVLPASLVDLTGVDLEHEGLYATLRATGLAIRVARQRIGARRADEADADLLGESVGAPLLTMQRTAYDDSGHAVEYGRHAYRPDLYSFDMTLVDR